MEAVRKLEKELENTELKLSEAQAGKLLEGLKDGKSVDSMVAELKTWCERIEKRVKPSKPYDTHAKPSGKPTKITDKMDDTTKRSLKKENESAETIAKNGYEIEQNPIIEGTTRKPDYRIEGEIFDCYSPEANTSTRSIQSVIKEKVIKKKQANRIVLNLDDWKGSIDTLIQELVDYPVEGLEEVLVVKDNTVFSIYP